VLRNDGGNAKNWLLIRLVGQKSNHDGIGAVIKLAARLERSNTRP